MQGRLAIIGVALLGAALSGCSEQTCESDADCDTGSYCDSELKVCFSRGEAGDDPVAPNSPTGLTATPEVGQIVVSWSAGTEAGLAKYNLFWGTSAEALDQTATIAAPETTHTVTDLTEGTTYFFAIDAENTAGQKSPRSAVVSATPIGPPPPTVLTTSPEDGAVGLPRNPTLTVLFSKPMNQEAAESAFEITSPPGFDTGTFSWNGAGTLMSFHPASTLDYGASVTYRVSAAALDADGIPLTAELNRTFQVIQLATTTLASTASLDGEVCTGTNCFGSVKTTNTAVSIGRDVSEYGVAVRRLFLSFDLQSITPVPTRILSAELSVNHEYASGTPFDTDEGGISPLVVESVTYGPALEAAAFDLPVHTDAETLPLSKPLPTTPGRHRTDVTPLVRADWLRTTNDKRSQMRIRFERDASNPTNQSNFAVYSTAEAGTNQPGLIITYEHP